MTVPFSPLLERLKHVFILGGGRTGRSAGRWLQSHSIQVHAWDDNPDTRRLWAQEGIPIVDTENEPSWNWHHSDGLLVAPGIPHRWPYPHPVVQKALHAGVPLLSELDLWAQTQPHAQIVGVTGTNGKSTTTALIHHILQSQGYSVAMGGNIGISVFDLPLCEIYVLELSSYQLERTQDFRVNVGILLNITPDHLDRHGGMAGYITAKQSLFRHHTTAPQTFIIGMDTVPTETLADWVQEIKPSTHRVIPIHMSLADLSAFDPRPASLNGVHNAQNMLCAYEAGRALGLTHEAIIQSFQTFQGLAHRQELILHSGSAMWVNDSKATNIASVCTALACFDRVYWIAGGRPKYESLDPLLMFRERIQHTFLIGEAASSWSAFLQQHHMPFDLCGTLDHAVEVACHASQSDPQSHTVLLSPGCASFDQFAHFEARGQAFKDLVHTRFTVHS